MKRKTSILLSLIMVLVMATPAFAAVNLDFNGKSYQPASEPYLEGGVTRVTPDFLINTLGCDVTVAGEIINIVENDNVVQMTLGSTAASVNGVAKTMLRAPEVIEGKTYIPLRFVYESLGGAVEWDGQTETVAIAYNEMRDGMTADELMGKSSAVVTKAGRYKMAADVQSDIDMTVRESAKDEQTMKMKMDSKIEAWLQAEPLIMYMKQKAAIDMPSAPSPAPQAIDTEMVLNQDGMFMTMPDIGWVKMDLEGLDIQALMKQSMAQDPATAMQQVKDMGMCLSFANDQVKNDKQYWVLNGTMGGDIFKSDYFKQFSQQIPAMEQDVDMQKLLQDMDLDLVYAIWIDKETFYNDYMDMTGNMKLNMDMPASQESQGGSMAMAMDMTASYTMSDYGKEFSIPEIKDARSMQEVTAEQMAVPEPGEVQQ